ncbi:hypothetical protein ABRQ22_03075 [Cellulosimicrobium sp. ES-005]|uniref:Uncharacterized protein n=1 Tax=Cellulosimicrobium sp. ES-005 TaxID=3163031 RepID=A0AAU8G238_9MICO
MTSRTPPPAPRARRSVEHARSYGPLLRLADRMAGRTDRRRAAPLGIEARRLPWPARLDATWRENDLRQLSATTDRLAPAIDGLHRAFGQVERLDRELAELEARAAVLPAPRSGSGGGEVHLSAEQVASRRAREHAAARAAASARADQVRARRADALDECVRLRSLLLEEIELAREVSDRLRWYYTRRLQTYARALRVAPADGTTPRPSPWEASEATWTGRPCPWLPDGLGARLRDADAPPSLTATPGPEQKEHTDVR